jgi:hypothetical protein
MYDNPTGLPDGEYISERLSHLIERTGPLTSLSQFWCDDPVNASHLSEEQRTNRRSALTTFYSGVETLIDYFLIRKLYEGDSVAIPCKTTLSVYESFLRHSPLLLQDIAAMNGCELDPKSLSFETATNEEITKAWVGACVVDRIKPSVGPFSIFSKKLPNLWAIDRDVERVDGNVYKLQKQNSGSTCLINVSSNDSVPDTDIRFVSDEKYSPSGLPADYFIFPMQESLGLGFEIKTRQNYPFPIY